MAKEVVSFKKSRIVQTTFLLLLMGFLCSFVPEENWILLGFNVVLSLTIGFVFFLLWRYNRQNSKRYFSLLSYFMLVALSVFFSIPLFRVFADSFIFWIALFFLIAMAAIPYFISERIARGVQNPTKSALGRVYMITVPLIIGFGTILFLNANLSANPDAFTISIFLFFGAVFFLFIAPILLITPERMNELNK
ncbi:hypothetical protein [Rossellomorea aquimaris]|uniref:Uncharacterized protein n=1 Tax=Rossellomorea aquimaris TaxID=189382 RepID=A0A1J6X3H4_9BACI|nr:hypothetical protein [Rossellomorea aquimaris]OIU72681.1 hypothetical protein BHE18_21315 [Rossellomorea aquimaris]